MVQVLRILFLPITYFVGICGILYFNPRLDWITVFWMFALSIILGILHYFINKYEKSKILTSIDQLSDLIHSIEKQEIYIPLKDDIFGGLRDEICKSLVSQRHARDDAIRTKEKLKSNMEDITHQIKTPLTGVLLLLDLLESDTSHSIEYQRRIRQEIEHLYELSDLILKLSSLDTDAIVFEKTSFTAKGILDDVELSIDYLMHQKNISIEVLGDDLIFLADRVWLLQALINVVKNAVEVSPQEGEVSIILHQNAIFQSIIVRDSGPGLTQEEQNRIFDRFYKSNPKSSGFGIGLALAQSIVKQQGGEILVHSTSQGSEFELRFYSQVTKEKELV